MPSSSLPERSDPSFQGARGNSYRYSRPALNRPHDFARFWEMTTAELEGVYPDVVREPLREEHPILRCERLSFSSLGGARVSGYMIRWADDTGRPLVVHAHGYDGGLVPMWYWARAGMNVIGVHVRGYGKSSDAVESRSPWGYVLTGIESPENHVLRGAICDYVRAVEVGRELLASHTSRTVVHGSSFAGGLSVMAESLLQVADLLVAQVPSLGWVDGRRLFARAGSGGEINRFLEQHPDQEDRLLKVLSYFDPINFAGDVRCPALVGVGLADEVVPPQTVYAIADYLGGPYEVAELPVSHSTLPEERLWENFEAYWLRLAVRGVPSGFGNTQLIGG